MTRATTEAVARALHAEFGRMNQHWARMGDNEKAEWLKRAERIEALSAPPMGEAVFEFAEMLRLFGPCTYQGRTIAHEDLYALAQPGSDGREAIEHLRRCVQLVPEPGAIEAAERFLATTPAIREGGESD